MIKKMIPCLLLFALASTSFAQHTQMIFTKEQGDKVEKQVLVFDGEEDLEEHIDKLNMPMAIKNELKNDFSKNYQSGSNYEYLSVKDDVSYNLSINDDHTMVFGDELMIDGADGKKRIIITRDNDGENGLKWFGNGNNVLSGGSKAYIGLSFDAYNFKEDATRKNLRGVTVVDIVEGEAAFNAGLEKGDVITMLNEVATPSPSLFLDAMSELQPRDEVVFTIDRDGKTMKLKSIVGKKEQSNNFYQQNGEENIFPFNFQEMELENLMDGLELENLMEGIDLDKLEGLNFDFENLMDGKVQLGVGIAEDDKGVKIETVEKGSAAEKAGLKAGDIITKVDKQQINSTSDLIELIQSKKTDDEITIQVLRNGKKKKVNAKLQERKMTFFFRNEEG